MKNRSLPLVQIVLLYRLRCLHCLEPICHTQIRLPPGLLGRTVSAMTAVAALRATVTTLARRWRVLLWCAAVLVVLVVVVILWPAVVALAA